MVVKRRTLRDPLLKAFTKLVYVTQRIDPERHSGSAYVESRAEKGYAAEGIQDAT